MIGRTLADIRAIAHRFLQDEGLLLASALSFSFVLCLAPLALILFSIAGFLLESDEIAKYLFDTVSILLPAYVREVAEFLSVLAKERAVTGILGGIALAIFASQLFSLTRRVLNRAFRVRVPRGWLHGVLFDLFAVGVIGLLVIAVILAIVTLATVGGLAARLSPLPLPPSLRLRPFFSTPVVYGLGGLLLFLVYRTFPNTPVSSRAAAAATVTVATSWEAARWIFTAYVWKFGVYGELYGSFGVLVATLAWIYYSAVIFVFGAELGALVMERSQAALPGRASTPAGPRTNTSLTGKGTMAFKYALLTILASVIAVFALYNSAPTSVRFPGWALEGVPLAAVILVSVAVGIVLAGLPLSIDRWRLRSRVRRLESRLATVERLPAERKPPDLTR